MYGFTDARPSIWGGSFLNSFVFSNDVRSPDEVQYRQVLLPSYQEESPNRVRPEVGTRIMVEYLTALCCETIWGVGSDSLPQHKYTERLREDRDPAVKSQPRHSTQRGCIKIKTAALSLPHHITLRGCDSIVTRQLFHYPNTVQRETTIG